MLGLRGKEREGGVGEGAERTSENEIEYIQFLSEKRGVGIKIKGALSKDGGLTR